MALCYFAILMVARASIEDPKTEFERFHNAYTGFAKISSQSAIYAMVQKLIIIHTFLNHKSWDDFLQFCLQMHGCYFFNFHQWYIQKIENTDLWGYFFYLVSTDHINFFCWMWVGFKKSSLSCIIWIIWDIKINECFP